MPLDIRNGSLTRPTAALPERAPLLCRANFDSRTHMPGTASGIPKMRVGLSLRWPSTGAHRFRARNPLQPGMHEAPRPGLTWSNFKIGLRFSETYAKLSHRHAWRCHLSLDIRGWPDSGRSCQPCVHPITRDPRMSQIAQRKNAHARLKIDTQALERAKRSLDDGAVVEEKAPGARTSSSC